MAKKTFELFCFGCDLDCKVSISAEDLRVDSDELYCPFCGELIEASDEESEDEEYSANKDESSWD